MKRSLFALCLGLALACAAWAAPTRTTPGVVPPNSTAYGKTLAEWSIAWWQWFMATPVSQSPMFDTSETPANVLIARSGHILFPPCIGYSGAVNRYATLPSGHPLLIPVLTTNEDQWVCPGWTLKDMQDDLTWSWNHATVSASVDGVPVRDLDRYRFAATGVYDIPATDSPWQFYGLPFDPGPCAFATEGWWIMLTPPSVGRHTVTTSYRIYYPEFPPPNYFHQDVTFILDIVPAGQLKK